MTTETRTSEYHYTDWWPRIKLIDLIPGVGIVTIMERIRRERGHSVTEAYLPWRFPQFQGLSRREITREVLSLGTANWPEETNFAASLRANLMAARNGLFMAYHAAGITAPIHLGLALLRSLGS